MRWEEMRFGKVGKVRRAREEEGRKTIKYTL